MSYYYDYYIGYKDKETKKIYPLGPFDCFKHFHPILSRSSFFASDLHDDFYSLGKECDLSLVWIFYKNRGFNRGL